MLNSGFRGKRATDGTGAISVQTQSVQATYPLPKINYWRVTDNNYVPYDDTAATSGATIVVYGNNFVSGMTVYINNSLVSATYLDSTRITFTMPALTNGTYIIYMITPQGSAAILSPGITYSGFPSWTASLYNSVSTTVNIQLLVTGDGPLTYSLQAGSTLPTGITLTSTGLLTGTATGVTTQTAFTFVVIVDDAQLQSTQQSIVLTFLFDDPQFKYTTLLLNGETTVTPFINDASANNFALTIVGDTKPALFNPYTPGYYSNYFDGNGDYLSIPYSTSISQTSPYTVEFWFYPTYNPTSQYIFAQNGGGAFALSWTGTVMRIDKNGVGIQVTGTTTLALNQWHHYAMTYDGTTTRVFANGALDGSVAGTGGLADVPTTIGYYTAVSTSSYGGYISNFRWVSGTAVYTSAFTPPTTPLTAISGTSLLTCQSNRFIDNSTNNFTITKVGDTIVSPNNPFTSNSSYSTYGSTYFDGTGDYLTIVNNANLAIGTGDFTVECWVYPQTTTQFTVLFLTATFQIFVYNGALYWNDGAQTSGGTITLNTWQHIAVSRSGTALKGFVNGVQVITTTSSVNLTQSTNYIGYNGGTVGQGYISDLRIVKGTAVYTSAFTPPTTPLTAIANTSLLTLQYNGGATNKGIIDNSNFNNIITRAGNASQGSFSPYSVTGWSNYFNGSAGYITSASSTNNSLGSGNYTIEFWCYSNSLGGSSAGSPFYVDSGGYQQLIRHNGSNWECYYRSGASFGYVAIPTGNITLNAWTHHALVRSSGTVKWYINGVQYASTSDATNYTSATFFVIGNYAGYIYDGYVSNVRVVKGTAVYTSAFTPPTTPLTPILGTVFLTAQSNRFIDNGPNNNTLTITSTPSVQAFGPFGSVPEAVPISYSNYFDGTGDYLSIPDNTALDLATGGGATAPFTGAPSFTIECWFYCTALTATPQDILNKDGTSGSAYTQYSFTITSAGLLKLVLGHGENGSTNNGTEQSFTILNSISLNTWYHVAACQATPNQIYTFLNGVLIATTTRTQYMANGSGRPLLIGYHTGQASTYAFNGYVSNVRIIKGTALYTSSFTPSTTPLTAIANTSLLTCQSNRFIDNSTNNFTITANGNTVPRIFNPFGYTAQSATSYTPSIHGGSAYFDGTGDNLTIPNSAFDLTPTTWSIEYWIYPTTIASGYYGLWALSTSGFRQGIYTDSGTHYLAVLNGGGGYGGFSLVASNKVITLNNWQHVALTSDGTTIRQFYNGVQTSTGSAASFSASTPTIGSWGGANYFTGYMSDFRITKGSAVYTSNFVPPTSPLTAIANTSLLTNFTNAGIIDQTGQNNLETVGNAQLSTAVKKYGSASIYFDGTGDYIYQPSSINYGYGTGNFTIEFWLYLNSTGLQTILSHLASNPQVKPHIYYSSGVRLYINGSDVITGGTVTISTWTHIALVRNSGSTRLYINGTQSGSTYTDSNNYGTSSPLIIGDYSVPVTGTNMLNGYIDDLRITKGYARYTTTFTPPTAIT